VCLASHKVGPYQNVNGQCVAVGQLIDLQVLVRETIRREELDQNELDNASVWDAMPQSTVNPGRCSTVSCTEMQHTAYMTGTPSTQVFDTRCRHVQVQQFFVDAPTSAAASAASGGACVQDGEMCSG
jgi:hypothetical protein